MLITICLLIFAGTINCISQKVIKNLNPKSFSYQSDKYPLTHIDSIDRIILAKVNKDSLLKEDSLNYLSGRRGPLRFGFPVNVNYNLNNSGTWDIMKDSSRIWRLRIKSSDAASLHFIFSKYELPKDALLFIYDKDKNGIIGALSSKNNKSHGKMSTWPLKGEDVILEYYEPKKVAGQGKLEISYIIHGYRDITEFSPNIMIKSKNSIDQIQVETPDCSRSVNCPEGDDWCKEKRSVCRILFGNWTEFIAPGFLVNNANNDFTPYIITSFANLDENNNGTLEQSEINACQTLNFQFNFIREECDHGTEGPIGTRYSSSTFKAAYLNTYIILLEMDEIPDTDDDVYYAGWKYTDPENEPVPKITCLHHPYGYPMQISWDDDYAETSTLPGYESRGSVYWKLQFEEDGNYFDLYDGGPYFNSEHKVIGHHTAHSTEQRCYQHQYGGKFSESWIGGGTPSTQLKNWLAPNSTGDIELEGLWSRNETITLYGLIRDPEDPRSNDYGNSPPYLPTEYFNIGAIITGGGFDDSWNARPFKTRFYPDDGMEGSITLTSKTKIVMKPCTQILKGTKFLAHISCSNATLADSTEYSYTYHCDGHHPPDPNEGNAIDEINKTNEEILSISPAPSGSIFNISINSNSSCLANLYVTDILGLVSYKIMKSEEIISGRIVKVFDASDLPSGIYFCTLQTPERTLTKQFVVVK